MPASQDPDGLQGEIYLQLVDSITQRYRSTAEKSLLDVYRLDEDFLDLDPDHIAFLIKNRAQVTRILSDPDLSARFVDLFLNQTIEFTYASNQFIRLNTFEEAVLREIYRSYLNGFAEILGQGEPAAVTAELLRDLVASHFARLRANLTRFFDPETLQDEQANVILKKVVCFEYSPAFQLDLLGIRLENLVQPVLDLGCGKTGGLVKMLNGQRIRAMGVDRITDGSPDLIEADWLDLTFDPDTWGSIISHMAFSNHFNFHHLYRHGSPEKYARQYLAILASLKPGGSFYYSPGLPFIERYLPDEKYRVVKLQSLRPHSLGENVIYATQVTRRT